VRPKVARAGCRQSFGLVGSLVLVAVSATACGGRSGATYTPEAVRSSFERVGISSQVMAIRRGSAVRRSTLPLLALLNGAAESHLVAIVKGDGIRANVLDSPKAARHYLGLEGVAICRGSLVAREGNVFFEASSVAMFGRVRDAISSMRRAVGLSHVDEIKCQTS
jgi:hypothetical protein